MSILTFTRVTAKEDGADLLDESTPAGKAFHHTINDARENGKCKKVYYGREVESPNNFWAFAEYESVEDRQAYVKSESGHAASREFGQYIDIKSVLVKHFKPSPSPSTLFSTSNLNAVEVLSLHFPADLTPSEQSTAEALWDDFAKRGLEPSPDYKGTIRGWSVEDDVPVLDNGDKSAKGKAYLLLLGWTSVESHRENQGKQHFLDALPNLLEKMPRRNGISMCHILPQSK